MIKSVYIFRIINRNYHVYTKGSGFLGVLGHGNVDDCKEFTKIEGNEDFDPIQIACGWYIEYIYYDN